MSIARGYLIRPIVLLTALACSHSEAFVAPANTGIGPFGTGPEVQLTFNVDQDYWPTWTQDGRGILYAFVDAESALPPYHRCLGLLPAGGGTRTWQLCDNRAVRDGIRQQLRSVRARQRRAAARRRSGGAGEPRVRAGSECHPLARGYRQAVRADHAAHATANGERLRGNVDFGSHLDRRNTFIALGQQFNSLPHCDACRCSPCPRDSIWGDGGVVLIGAIVGNTAILQAVSGTDSATSYSIAENGTSIVFTRHHDLRLFKVPIGGGAPAPPPVLRTVPDTGSLLSAELVGVSCKGITCIVASDGIFLTDAYSAPFQSGFGCPPPSNPCLIFAGFLGPMQLRSISLATGAVQVVQTGAAVPSQVYASPKISPVSGDVVVQRGGVWGHLQTYATPGRGNGDLYLISGVVP